MRRHRYEEKGMNRDGIQGIGTDMTKGLKRMVREGIVRIEARRERTWRLHLQFCGGGREVFSRKGHRDEMSEINLVDAPLHVTLTG